MTVAAQKLQSTPAGAKSLSSQQRLDLYYYMLLTREVDNAVLRLYRQGKIVGGAYTSYGNEATAVGSAFALEDRDYLFPMHRDLGAHLVKGQSLKNIFLQQLGRSNSLTRGRDGTGHYADPSLKIYGNVSHLAAMIPMAVGAALAAKLRKEQAVVMNYIGDGGCNVGDFHEGLNMAAVMKLPLVLIIENNQFAYSTPNAKQFVAQKLSDRGIGYGIQGHTIDGTDVEKVHALCRESVEHARHGGGPALIETITMRMHGHSASDDASYVPKGMTEEWKKKDPIDRYQKILMNDRVLNAASLEQMHLKISSGIEEAIRFAEESSYSDGADAVEGVYAE